MSFLSQRQLCEQWLGDLRRTRRGRARGWSSSRSPRRPATATSRSTTATSRSSRSTSSDDGPSAGNSPGEIPPRRRRDLSGEEILRAREYLRVLGVGGGASVHAKGWTGRGVGHEVFAGALGEWRLASALRGGKALDVAGLKRTSLLVFDLDVHDVDLDGEARGEAAADPGLDAYLDATGAEVATARRRLIARRVRKTLRAIRRVVPSAIDESSGRGAHVSVVLDRLHPVEEVRAFGLEVLRRAGLDEKRDHVEVFPKVDGNETGRTCRLPLTGGGRLLCGDLVSFRHSRRASDVQALLDAPRVALAPLQASGTTSPSLPIRDSHPQGPEITRGGDRKRRVRNAPEGQLFGGEFCRAVVEQAACIPAGGSWSFARRCAAMLVYAGVDDDEAVALFRALIARHGHEAQSCRDPRARRDLLCRFRGQLRHQRRGVDAGSVRPGLLKNKAAWGLIRALRADADIPAHVTEEQAPARPWSEIVAARKAAKARAWETRRAKARGELVEADPLQELDAEIDRAADEVARLRPGDVLAEFLLQGVLAQVARLEHRRNIVITERRLRR